MSIDTALVGQNIEFIEREPYGMDFTYVDDYLRSLSKTYPIGANDFEHLAKDSSAFTDILQNMDIDVSDYTSAHAMNTCEMVKYSIKRKHWLGWVQDKKDSQWFLSELRITPYSRLTVNRSHRGTRELLVSGYWLSPNEALESDMEDKMIVIPSEKLVQYLMTLKR